MATSIIGRESVGKSQLIASLSGQSASEANFRGSTVSVERYPWGQRTLIDTPGIHRLSDADTTRRTLSALSDEDNVIVVVQATSLDEDLDEMLQLVQGKKGVVVVAFWDKVLQGEAALEAIEKLERCIGVPFLPVNGREITDAMRKRFDGTLSSPSTFRVAKSSIRTLWRIEPKPGVMEHRVLGPLLAMSLLFLPALATIFFANSVAAWLHPIVDGCI